MQHFNFAVELKKCLWGYFYVLPFLFSCSPLWNGPIAFRWRISFRGGEGGIEFSSKISMYVWKLFYLLIPVVPTKYLLQKECLFWTLFLTSQYFRVYKISKFCKLISFSQRNTKSKYDSRFVRVFWRKISFISVNKSTQNIQTPAFAKISIGKNNAA